MKKQIVFFIFLSFTNHVFSQNKMGNTWLLGGARTIDAKFIGANKPIINIRYDNLNAGFPYYFASAGSNICDSATGKLLFFSNAMRIWDSTGAIMQNGDSLQPFKAYTQNNPALLGQTQGSLILPKGDNGEYYVFIPTVSDSTYNWFWTGASGTPKAPFDMLYYNVVDLNANGGLGSIVVKNKKLIHDKELYKVGMQACRHSNGRDWWLIKQGGYDKNEIIKFLVTKDTIYGPFFQNFNQPKYTFSDLSGQISFSKDGMKVVSVGSTVSKVFVADFDRCSGAISNPKVFNIPIDSTTIPNPQPQYLMDSLSNGVCYSPNGKYLYITKRYNIYQFEFDEPDSILAWTRIQHGPDTTYQKFQYYGHLYLGPDERLYIGNWGGTAKQFSVIDYPNIKGLGCGFCRKCFRLDSNINFAITAPPNMPDYTLGADLSKVCWPLGSNEILETSDILEIFPNPTSTLINIKTESKANRQLFNSIGQLLFTTTENQINLSADKAGVSKYSSGIYYIKVGNEVRKIIIE